MAKVKIELMESNMITDSNGETYKALAIDDTRYGPDAGPWDIVQTFSVDAAALKEVAEKALAND